MFYYHSVLSYFVYIPLDEKNGAGSSSKSRAHIAGSMGGEVPEKYYVIRNNEMMRVKYLMVYAASKQKR